MNIFDASALLAYVSEERGRETVEATLESGGYCTAANWAEVAQHVRLKGGDWLLTRSLLLSTGLTLAPISMDDPEWAADRWRRGEGLSLADRLCMAVAERLNVVPLPQTGIGAQRQLCGFVERPDLRLGKPTASASAFTHNRSSMPL